MRNKSTEGKNKDTDIDIHGRIESMDQGLRSVDNRLRAVEKRLSIKSPDPDSEWTIYDAAEDLKRLREQCNELEQKLTDLEKRANGLPDDKAIEEQLSAAGQRITKLENLNKLTIGKIKVPVELSGVVAMIVLLITGFLISQDKWTIIRSYYYPIVIGLLFGAAVVGKFIMTNRK